MSDIAIKIEHLTKVYKIFDKPTDRVKEALNPFGKRYSKDFYALNDLNIEIKKGETVGIIGKNGAGKSTLLKIITGVLTPTSGNIQVNGRIASLLELGAGFNPEMTGIENIYMNGSIMGYSREDMDARLQNIVDFADIGEFINQPVKMYSSGMFARLAFAVNAFVEPDILIVDEALSVGDVSFQAKCISKMRQLMEKGVTILFVTHDISSVKSFCNKCIYMRKGTLYMEGPSDEITDVYLRETRDEMNGYNQNVEVPVLQSFTSYSNDDVSFKRDSEFSKRSGFFRQGNNKAEFTALDVVDDEGNNVLIAEFDQKIHIRMYIVFNEDVNVAVGYHIRDDKNQELLGTFLPIEENGKLINGSKGDGVVVEFITKLPLIEGNYNITLVISQPVNGGTSAVFCDLIENAYVFNVEARRPTKIWNKVYIPVDYKASYVKNVINKIQLKCSCCGNFVDEYIPIPAFYIEEQLKNGVTRIAVPEMVNGEAYSCPHCGAADRDRAYAVWMDRCLPKDRLFKILDIAPSVPLQRFIKRTFPKADYKTGDLFMEGVDYKLDIMNMHQLADNSIDFFVCSHVLEHVRDDIQAMKELHRVLSPNGCGILVVPIDLLQEEIDEDPDCTDISERWRRFGQDDHIRKYSRQGYRDRLNSVFNVEMCRKEFFGELAMIENALIDESTVYIVRKKK
ncbi:MAG: ATP-binding cassette domain-containing protein [Selenomonadaceae bacterium]|nr:ATP-binding cassette domain-containing protein [Selenomonadaceae bacterium]